MTRAGPGDPAVSEKGSATVLFAGIIAALVVLGVTLLTLVGVLSAKTRAQAVADMGALAGADLSLVAVFEEGGAPASACAQARTVVERNSGVLDQCVVLGGDTYVHAAVPLRIGGMSFHVRARARAGPAAGP